jgi:hypothetical protein
VARVVSEWRATGASATTNSFVRGLRDRLANAARLVPTVLKRCRSIPPPIPIPTHVRELLQDRLDFAGPTILAAPTPVEGEGNTGWKPDPRDPVVILDERRHARRPIPCNAAPDTTMPD